MSDLKIFQRKAVAEAVALLSEGRPPVLAAGDPSAVVDHPRALLLEAPTGAGKTRMAGTIASRLCEIDKVVWFWFAPFAGVVGQASDVLRERFAGLRVRDIKSDRSLEELRPGDIYPVTWQAVAVREESTRLVNRPDESRLALPELIRQARVQGNRVGMVVDESHHGLQAGGVAADFVRTTLCPDHIVLVTATPDDADVEAFRRACGLPRISRISISRQDVVDEGLIKPNVRVVAFAPPAGGLAAPVDFARTAIRFGVDAHRAIALALGEAGYSVTPLMLVQVDSSPGSVELARATLQEFGIDPASIAVHTAAEPDPDLLAIASDENVQVLIFKMAVALGFDAPRAWTLVSMRRSRNIDFGVQVLGRVLRVDSRLFGLDLPTGLDRAYAFVADPDVQDGIISAADRINALTTDVRRVAPDAQLTLIQLVNSSATDLATSLAPSVHQDPLAKVPDEAGSTGQTIVVGMSVDEGNAADLFGIGRLPKAVRDSSAGSATVPQAIRYPLRQDIHLPNALLTERFPRAEEAIMACVADTIDFGPAALQMLSRSGVSVVRRTAEAFTNGPDRLSRDEVLADLAVRNLVVGGQTALFENDHVNGRSLLPALARRLTVECRRAGIAEWISSPARAEEGVCRIVGSDPMLLRRAVRECLARNVEVVTAAALPSEIVSSSPLPRSRLNVYGVVPKGLNNWERAFVAVLDDDVSDTVTWWHRNEPRKPEAVSICAPGTRYNYYPDFVVGVRGRRSEHSVILVETKHQTNSEDSMAKARAEHSQYGRVMMLTRTDAGQWWIVQYDHDREQVVRSHPFSIDRMINY
ncbi:DEAD/DEAH box helicase [Sphingomonas sp. OK281]|uniref:DEAD/DEAH box helicase n=1 Tax=Sphingomonas sp. OK281 TaxID=1881067 RepID=UPI0008EA3B2C|nr:DEAD/DEAH box helicase family protein [Sphingomonas sp. OK281]SFO44952.1 Superfamily II DNA or RNA helicase [Sphingomonas sp. OK281]